jgi:hypothetical protein
MRLSRKQMQFDDDLVHHHPGAGIHWHSTCTNVTLYETPSIVLASQFPQTNSARPQRNRHPPKKYAELGEDVDTTT